tara:strand:- start:98 stop:679 length:582 start_codon:yes stop_codon:yes gene_type:complete
LKSIYDIRKSKGRDRLLLLPSITPDGRCPWIHQIDFLTYGFKTGNGMMRHGTPEGFPQGLLWETKRKGNTITHIRCTGFSNEKQLTHQIAAHIRVALKDLPCIITGSTANVEIDHRAGNKTHPLHIHTDDVDKQEVRDFMPLTRSINQIKREACKQCIATGVRPSLPPMFKGRSMDQGQGCYRCFWFEPESYV